MWRSVCARFLTCTPYCSKFWRSPLRSNHQDLGSPTPGEKLHHTYTSTCEETKEKKTSTSVPCCAILCHDLPCMSVLARRESESDELIAFQLIWIWTLFFFGLQIPTWKIDSMYNICWKNFAEQSPREHPQESMTGGRIKTAGLKER